MNAINPAFASILNNICPPAAKQPMVDGAVWRTVVYDGLALDVYVDADGDYSGISLSGDKRHIGGILSDDRINEIERMAEAQMRAS